MPGSTQYLRHRWPELTLDVAAASAISMLVGPYAPAYSRSTWGPYGTMEHCTMSMWYITRLVLGDLLIIILSSRGAHGQSTFSTVRGTVSSKIFRDTFLFLPLVRIPGHPAMVPCLTSCDNTTEKTPVFGGTFVPPFGQSSFNSGVATANFIFAFGASLLLVENRGIGPPTLYFS